MVMLVLLTLILGSLAMVARTSSGLLHSGAQGRNREARDVAEAGLTEIVSELNKERNRKILVSGVPLADWNVGTASVVNNLLVNPCTRYDASGNLRGAVDTPTAKAIGFKNGWQTLVTGDNTRTYRLVSVTYSDASRVPMGSPTPTAVSSGQVKSLLRLTVEGRVNDAAGNTISTVRVVKEYEVVPKCCKRSFGRNSFAATNFGEDNRFCLSGGTAAVIGALYGGTINSSNNTLNIFNESLKPVTRILCRSNVPSPGISNPACVTGTMTLGVISVVPSPFNIPVPAWPGSASTPFSDVSAGSKTGLYVRVNPATQSVEQCELNGTSLSACKVLPSCVKVSGVINYVDGYYCRFSTINADKLAVVFDTSNAPLFIYFDTAEAPAPSTQKYIDYQGNGTVKQVLCVPPSSGVCTSTAGIANVERLNLYAYGSGAMGLNGADAVVTMNVFAPKASFTIKGGGSSPYNFIGRLWLNNFYANGSTTMQVAESSPVQFCPVDICPPGSTPEVDWVARSVTYSSAF